MNLVSATTIGVLTVRVIHEKQYDLTGKVERANSIIFF